eukprot:scaffold8593_cov248-Pinguiococcus_pyrenoidosus.AAC.13
MLLSNPLPPLGERRDDDVCIVNVYSGADAQRCGQWRRGRQLVGHADFPWRGVLESRHDGKAEHAGHVEKFPSLLGKSGVPKSSNELALHEPHARLGELFAREALPPHEGELQASVFLEHALAPFGHFPAIP